MNFTLEQLIWDFEIPKSRLINIINSLNINLNNITQREREMIYNELRNNKIRNLIFIDTSSLLCGGAENYINKLFKFKQSLCETKIIIPKAVMYELEKKRNSGLAGKADRIIDLIADYQAKGLLEIRGDDGDGTFADNVFHKIVTMFALNYNLTIITQDFNLAQDILKMTLMASVRHRKVKVFKLNNAGDVIEIKFIKKNKK